MVHFKIKKNTPLRKLMSAYCERSVRTHNPFQNPCNYLRPFPVYDFVCLSFQSVQMSSMRFRFDGNPIQETDTPSGVCLQTIWILIFKPMNMLGDNRNRFYYFVAGHGRRRHDRRVPTTNRWQVKGRRSDSRWTCFAFLYSTINRHH